jgi:hypothetical protein
MTLRLGRPIAALALIALAVPALARQPNPEQVSAIRSSCRSDFLSNCSGVPALSAGRRDAILSAR